MTYRRQGFADAFLSSLQQSLAQQAQQRAQRQQMAQLMQLLVFKQQLASRMNAQEMGQLPQIIQQLSGQLQPGQTGRITHKIGNTMVSINLGEKASNIPASTATGLMSAEKALQAARNAKQVGGIWGLGFGPGAHAAYSPDELSAMQHAVNLLKARVNGATGIAEPAPADNEDAAFLQQLQQQGYTVEPVQ